MSRYVIPATLRQALRVVSKVEPKQKSLLSTVLDPSFRWDDKPFYDPQSTIHDSR
ncbi:MAG TPA: hypothetical protein VJC18_09670 [bacterium]|nr:hypothetical protein [bacterium]